MWFFPTQRDRTPRTELRVAAAAAPAPEPPSSTRKTRDAANDPTPLRSRTAPITYGVTGRQCEQTKRVLREGNTTQRDLSDPISASAPGLPASVSALSARAVVCMPCRMPGPNVARGWVYFDIAPHLPSRLRLVVRMRRAAGRPSAPRATSSSKSQPHARCDVAVRSCLSNVGTVAGRPSPRLALPLLEAVLFAFIEQVRLRGPKIDNLGTPIALRWRQDMADVSMGREHVRSGRGYSASARARTSFSWLVHSLQ